MKVLEVARVLGVVAGCVVLGVPGTARAYSCATNWLQEPRDGATGVPTNTLIWVYGRFGGSGAARLVGPDGVVPLEDRFFPVAIASGMGSNYPISIPLEPLRPHTRYSIEVDYDGGEVGEDGTDRATFTTGDGPALNAPSIPQLVSSVPAGTRGYFGELQQVLALEFSSQGILIADNASALGDVGNVRDLFQPTTASLEALILSERYRVVRWLSAEPRLSVGLGECLVWPESGGLRQEARFGVLDLAGNFSGWSELTELSLPSQQEALVLAEEAEAARADEAAAPVPARKKPLGPFEDHNTGCSLRAASPDARAGGSLLAALLGAGLVWCARMRRAFFEAREGLGL